VSAATNREPFARILRPLAVNPSLCRPQHRRHGQYAVTSMRIVRGARRDAGGGDGREGAAGFGSGAGSAGATDLAAGTAPPGEPATDARAATSSIRAASGIGRTRPDARRADHNITTPTSPPANTADSTTIRPVGVNTPPAGTRRPSRRPPHTASFTSLIADTPRSPRRTRHAGSYWVAYS